MATLRKKKGFIPAEEVEEVSFEKSEEDVQRMHEVLSATEIGIASKKWEKVDAAVLKAGDRVILYGLEVGKITKPNIHEAYIEYEWKGKNYVGLPPRKTKEQVTRIVEK